MLEEVAYDVPIANLLHSFAVRLRIDLHRQSDDVGRPEEQCHELQDP